MSGLKNKVIWLTGASSGIGEALVYELAREGAKLVLSARRKAELERVKHNCTPESQLNIRILPLDLSQPDSLAQATREAIQVFGHVDILINNGGISQRSLIRETTMEVDRRIMEVNYFGAVALTKNLLPHFVDRKAGHFVTLSSVTGKFGTPFRSGYAASKHALHGFFDSVRAEHWKDNIFVTMICPGFINTPITLAALKGDGSPLNEVDKAQAKGKPAEWCAKRIVRAIERKREEVYIGGKEVLGVYIKRLFPSLFSKIIRKVPVR
ncbi:MAG: SDR family oxidoreductase [Cyclobacteriaceae bacterium]|jgi:short-subunit dehydrogenase|nr:SDR family oxidoreductase [Cyclobacteriaceae bacterium]MDH4295969.1 SDR family oxidoreductase [Cyclobacteriaceae bacterium]MDH5250128.1 SDR family oxidoreductase [Cyclobacteriaceae bacterium]